MAHRIPAPLALGAAISLAACGVLGPGEEFPVVDIDIRVETPVLAIDETAVLIARPLGPDGEKPHKPSVGGGPWNNIYRGATSKREGDVWRLTWTQNATGKLRFRVNAVNNWTDDNDDPQLTEIYRISDPVIYTFSPSELVRSDVPPDTTLRPGEQRDLSALALGSFRVGAATYRTHGITLPSLVSLNPDIARVEGNRVVGVAPGTATLQWVAGPATSELRITVADGERTLTPPTGALLLNTDDVKAGAPAFRGSLGRNADGAAAFAVVLDSAEAWGNRIGLAEWTGSGIGITPLDDEWELIAAPAAAFAPDGTTHVLAVAMKQQRVRVHTRDPGGDWSFVDHPLDAFFDIQPNLYTRQFAPTPDVHTAAALAPDGTAFFAWLVRGPTLDGVETPARACREQVQVARLAEGVLQVRNVWSVDYPGTGGVCQLLTRIRRFELVSPANAAAFPELIVVGDPPPLDGVPGTIPLDNLGNGDATVSLLAPGNNGYTAVDPRNRFNPPPRRILDLLAASGGDGRALVAITTSGTLETPAIAFSGLPGAGTRLIDLGRLMEGSVQAVTDGTRLVIWRTRPDLAAWAVGDAGVTPVELPEVRIDPLQAGAELRDGNLHLWLGGKQNIQWLASPIP